jgi:hypothetical protein
MYCYHGVIFQFQQILQTKIAIQSLSSLLSTEGASYPQIDISDEEYTGCRGRGTKAYGQFTQASIIINKDCIIVEAVHVFN